MAMASMVVVPNHRYMQVPQWELDLSHRFHSLGQSTQMALASTVDHRYLQVPQ
jgi:hypothetical protein